MVSLTAALGLTELVCLLLCIALASASSASQSQSPNLADLDYEVFPKRRANEAAVVEWGHSAIISALDAAVASFGSQTSLGAFFEVEAIPVLAVPIDGDVEVYEGSSATDPSALRLANAAEVEGNLVVMTNAAGLTGVEMARLAKNSGAAALMVVNTDQDHPDYIYALEPETEEEAAYARDNIDFPVFMVSRTSGNVLTTDEVEEGMSEEAINSLPNRGMPERVRLYDGGDRPFFEDVTSVGTNPTVYLIHNMLTDEECDALITTAEPTLRPVDDTRTNVLEHTVATQGGTPMAIGVERTMIWKGKVQSHAGKQIEERIDQVTGYPEDHFSDWQVNRYVSGSFHAPHYDVLPTQVPIATISVFLNDVPKDGGGEIVFPSVSKGSPIKVRATKGLAVVHHNTDDQYQFDRAAVTAELELLGGEEAVKYVARKFVYGMPQSPARRYVLPIVSMATGGRLPDAVVTVHDKVLETFGPEDGPKYFDKLMQMSPVALLLLVACAINAILKIASGNGAGDRDEKKKKTVSNKGSKKD